MSSTVKGKYLLFVPAENPASIATLEPVATLLESRGFKHVFLSMERIYPYGTGNVLKDNGLRHVEIPLGSSITKRNRPRYLQVYYKVRMWARGLMRRLRPAVVVTMKNTGIPGLFVLAAKEKRIPTLLVQEAFIGELKKMTAKLMLNKRRLLFYIRHAIKLSAFMMPPPFDFVKLFTFRPEMVLCDLFAVTGKQWFDAFYRYGVPPGRMVLTGSPAYDSILRQKRRSDPKQLPKEARNLIGKKIVLFPQSPMSEGGERSIKNEDMIYKNIIESCSNIEGVELLIKVHPRDSIEHVSSRIKSIGLGGLRYHIYKGGTVDDILPFCSVLVTPGSTTLLNALIHDVPAILIGYLDFLYPPRFDESDVTVSKRPEDTAGLIRNAIFDDGTRNQMIEKGRKFLEKLVYKPNAGSARVIAGLVEKLASRR